MPSARNQTLVDQRTYIPPHIAAAMDQHLQQSVPGHLRQYVGEHSSYVPRQAESAIGQHLQETLPAHLKQYAGAYLQQRIAQPNTARLTQPVTPAAGSPAPLPDRLRQAHSGEVAAAQYDAQFHNNLFAPDPPPASSLPVAGPSSTPPPKPTAAPYDFIVNPEQSKPKRSLPGGNSAAVRALIFAGGLFLLLIVFIVVKNLFGGGNPNVPALISVAQDQQEIIHLTSNATQQGQNQQSLSTTSQNFAVTAQLSFTSAQSQLLTYLSSNGTKVSTKQLGQKVSSSLDNQLTTAEAASTYDQTFQQVLQNQLTTYSQDLKRAYTLTKGPKGQKLLSDDYDDAQLLLKQLSSPAS